MEGMFTGCVKYILYSFMIGGNDTGFVKYTHLWLEGMITGCEKYTHLWL